MENKYTVIDEGTWPRTMHCYAFRKRVEPCFCVTFEVDVTGFYQFVKEKDLSFTLAMVYAICSCANKVEAFRYRFKEGKIVLYDHIDTSFTYLNLDIELYKVVEVPLKGTIEEYCAEAKKTADEQTAYFTGPLSPDVFQCSPNPWVSYTHISHTISGDSENAMPVFDWGKFYRKEDRLIMPVSVQGHHSFVDGLHIGKFAKELESYLSSF